MTAQHTQAGPTLDPALLGVDGALALDRSLRPFGESTMLPAAAYTCGDSRNTAARSGELAVIAPSVRVKCSRPSMRAASVSANAERVADREIE